MKKTNLWKIILILSTILVSAASTNDFFHVQGDKDTEDISCLGKPLPVDFRVGDEEILGPNGNKLYCCQRWSIINPFFISKIELANTDITPYIDTGSVDLYYADSKTETIQTRQGTILRNYLAWTKGILSFTLDTGEKRTMLVCSEKQNIMQTKKWGIQLFYRGIIYDKDPYYTSPGASFFHPNVSAGFIGQNLSNHLIENQTLNLTANYTDYCLANDCNAAEGLQEVFRFDNSLTGNNGTVAENQTGGMSFVKAVFGGSTGGLNLSNTRVTLGSATGVLNFSNRATFGWGGWFNITQMPAGGRLVVSKSQAGNPIDGNISLGCGNSDCSDVECYFMNTTGNTIFADKTGQGALVGDGQFHFLYCQKNTTHLCAYVDNLVPTCTAHSASSLGTGANNWILNLGYTGGPSNLTADEIQFRLVAYNNANISQWYHDGRHKLRPNDYSSNNSICDFYITNVSGISSLAKTQTLGFNITTCTLNITDSNLFAPGRNITANFTPVNNFETGSVFRIPANVTIVQIPNELPNIVLNQPANNTVFDQPASINFSFTIIDADNTTLNSRLIINDILNSSNATTQNNTLTNFSVQFPNTGNFTWFINVSDGPNVNVSLTRLFEVRGQGPQFLFRNNITNRTAFETTNQTYYINVSYNTSTFNITTNFIFGSTQFSLSQHTSTNDTSSSLFPNYNATVFRANIIPDIILTNNTNVTTSFNITKRYSNGTNETETYNDTQSIIFAYSVTALEVPTEITETEITRLTVNISKQAAGEVRNFSVFIEYNRTNNTATRVSNTSTFDVWETNITTRLINTQNESTTVFAYLNFTYASMMGNRTRANTTQIVHQMILTNCTSPTSTTIPTLNYSIRNETSNTTVLATTEMSYVVAKRTNNLNRTYGFTFSNNSAPQICIYPRGGSFNITSGTTIRYSASDFSTRYFYHNTTTITNLTQLFNLFVLSSSQTTTVSIQVIDQFSENIVGAIVKASKYDIPGNFYTFVDSESTGINGIALMQLEGNETYKFEIYVDGVLKKTEIFLVTTDFYTIKILLGTIVSLDAYKEITGMNSSITCNNGTGSITLTWNDSQNIAGQVCLEVYNMTGGITRLNQSCSTNDTGTLSFLNYTNTTQYLGLGRATSRTDELNYIIQRCQLILGNANTRIPFQLGGALLGLIVIGSLVLLGRGNPSLTLLLLIPGIAFTAIMGLLPLQYTAAVGIFAIIIILYVSIKRIDT